MIATVRIFLQKAPSKRTKQNSCPVKLVITHRRKRRYYSLRDFLRPGWEYLSKEKFDRIISKNPRGENKDIAARFDLIKQKAIDVIDKMDLFSFDRFEREFFNKPGNWHDVYYAFEDHIQNLKDDDRIGYASSFNDCFQSIKKYTKGKSLSFSDITPTWLKKYEKWLLNSGKSKATAGIYTRTLRRLFNLAIQEHNVKAEYPFNKYKPQQSTGRKRALTAKQINMIMNYKVLELSEKHFARDMFLFSFYANGMNLGDVFRLKYKNLNSDEIVFVREKTKNKATETKISIPLVGSLKDIISRWGQRSILKDAYIFPVLNGATTEQRKKELINFKIRNTNKHLKDIADDLEIEKFSTVAARHSFATILKNTGISVEFLKEALGHSDTSVTQNYLSGFEEDKRREISEKLETTIKSLTR